VKWAGARVDPLNLRELGRWAIQRRPPVPSWAEVLRSYPRASFLGITRPRWCHMTNGMVKPEVMPFRGRIDPIPSK
jgi:hypothetical protein